jgi:hypothetical protein
MIGQFNPAGGFSASSSAAAKSGDIFNRGDRAYGGINIGASNGFEIPTQSIFIAVSIAALYLFAKKQKFF